MGKKKEAPYFLAALGQNIASAIGSWGKYEKHLYPVSPKKIALQLRTRGRGSPVLLAVLLCSGVSILISLWGGGREWVLVQIPLTFTVRKALVDFLEYMFVFVFNLFVLCINSTS